MSAAKICILAQKATPFSHIIGRICGRPPRRASSAPQIFSKFVIAERLCRESIYSCPPSPVGLQVRRGRKGAGGLGFSCPTNNFS